MYVRVDVRDQLEDFLISFKMNYNHYMHCKSHRALVVYKTFAQQCPESNYNVKH